MFKKLKNKLKASTKSTTMGISVGLVAIGGVLSTEQGLTLIRTIVPEGYEGLAVAIAGVIVALARMRTVDKVK